MENSYIALCNSLIGDGVFRFGKHKGKTYSDVAIMEKEPDYFLWLNNNIRGKLDKSLIEFIDNNIETLKSLPKIEYHQEGDWGDYADIF